MKIACLLLCIIAVVSVSACTVLADYPDYRILHHFDTNFFLGGMPYAGVIKYGNYLYGGTYYEYRRPISSSLFRMKTDGSDYTALYTFDGPDDGVGIAWELLAFNGHLYGTTVDGGLYDEGTVFSIEVNGSNFTNLHHFGDFYSDGSEPFSPLIKVGDRLYGSTLLGGLYDDGTIYSLLPDGSDYQVIYSFCSCSNQAVGPQGGLVADSSRLYGTTTYGYHYNGGQGRRNSPGRKNGPGYYYYYGTIFSLALDGSDFTLLHTFDTNANNGYWPFSGLTSDGSKLYGTTAYGGAYDGGVIFTIERNGSGYTNLFEFGKHTNEGLLPYGGLLVDGSTLYGTTIYGDYNTNRQQLLYYSGTVFSFDLRQRQLNTLHHFGSVTNDGVMPLGRPIIANNTLYGTTLASLLNGFGAGTVYALDLTPGVPAAGDYTGATVERTAPLSTRSRTGIDVTGINPNLNPRLLVRSFTSPGHGTVTYDDNTGIFTYVPDINFSGIDTFTYTAYDGSVGTITIFVEPMAKRGDFDGDGRADCGVYWPENGNWYIHLSQSGRMRFANWGWAQAYPVTADYDGDGLWDIAVYWPEANTWFIQHSSSALSYALSWGSGPLSPTPADFDGDGQADIAAFNSVTGEWLIRRSTTTLPWTLSFGSFGSMPVPGDYDGDGTAEPAVYNPETGVWHIFHNGQPAQTAYWGWPGALPVPADYDGDGLTDFAVYWPENSTWYISQSNDGQPRIMPWGWDGATPVVADYDGDGRDDVAVYYAPNGNWYIHQSRTGTVRVFNWGWPEAVPVF
jgi:uncharacterized repeat protein (TIGR03803 family)